MNYSKVIKFANYLEPDFEISYKVGSNIIEKILNYFKTIDFETHLFDKYNKTMLEFYNKFLEPTHHKYKTLNEATYIFLAALLSYFVNSKNEEVKMLKSNNEFDNYFPENLEDKIAELMNRIEIKISKYEYDNYKRKIRKEIKDKKSKKYFAEIDERLVIKDFNTWEKEWNSRWIEKTGFNFWDNEEESDLYLYIKGTTGEPPTLWNGIVYAFSYIIKSAEKINLERFSYMNYEIMIDSISDKLSKLPLDKKVEILENHKNKIIKLNEDIDEAIKELKDTEKMEFNRKNTNRLSAEDTEKHHIENIENLMNN